MKKIIILMMLLMLPLALAETFTTDLEVVFNDGEVTLNYESGIIVYQANNQTESLTITLERTNNDSFDYLRLEDFMMTNRVNLSSIQHTCSEEIDEAMMNQQSYIGETFLPNIEELNQLRTDKEFTEKVLDNCNMIKRELERTISFINSSKTEYAEAVKHENGILVTQTFVMVILLVGGIAYYGYSRFGSRENQRAG